MYRWGDGVQKDEGEVFKWWRKAADLGHGEAQSGIGKMYADGRGVMKDEVEAEKWLQKAAANGDEEAKKRLQAIVTARESSKVAAIVAKTIVVKVPIIARGNVSNNRKGEFLEELNNSVVNWLKKAGITISEGAVGDLELSGMIDVRLELPPFPQNGAPWHRIKLEIKDKNSQVLKTVNYSKDIDGKTFGEYFETSESLIIREKLFELLKTEVFTPLKL